MKETNPEPGHDSMNDDRPEIKIERGQLPRMLNESDAALGASDPTIFAQRDRLVRIVTIDAQGSARNVRRPSGAVTVQTVIAAHLVDRLARAARFLKFNGRQGEWRDADVPHAVADSLIARAGAWRYIPQLLGIAEAPTLRADGTVLDRAGYDATSGIYVAAEPPADYDAPPELPIRTDALYALDELSETIRDFPFTEDADRAAAIAGILTVLFRRSLPSAPMVCFTAPTPGTGKSLLVDICAVIGTGRRAAVLSLGNDQTESEKRLASALLAGDTLISLDNVERPLFGDFLCQILTQPAAIIRPLGASNKISVPTNCSFFCTGNNLDFRGDLKRRILLARLDAGIERPEQRRFKRDALRYVAERRGNLIRASLTIVRAYLAAGAPNVDIAPFGSFEQWDAWCRRPLVWLGLPDPLWSAEQVRVEDPDITTQRQLFAAWRRLHGDAAVTAGELAQQAQLAGSDNDLQEAVSSACAEHISARRLGNWLRRHRGRVIDGYRLESGGMDNRTKVARWRVIGVAG